MSKDSQQEQARLRRKELERHMKAAGRLAGTDHGGTYLDIAANKIKKPDYYQRPFRENRAIDYALNFSWRAFHVLNVARRKDGSLYFMDGQHRLQAAMLAFGDRIEVPCMVYDVATMREEAEVYNMVNMDRRGLTLADKWKSRHAAEDPYVIEIESLLAEWGLTPAPIRGRTASEPGQVQALSFLEWALKKAGPGSIREVLGTLSAVFGDNPGGYVEQFLRGLWHFVIRYPDYNPKRLRTILMRHGVTWRSDFQGMDEGTAMALTIHQAYNHKEPPERRLAPFPLATKGHQSGQETNRAAAAYRAKRQNGDSPKASAA